MYTSAMNNLENPPKWRTKFDELVETLTITKNHQDRLQKQIDLLNRKLQCKANDLETDPQAIQEYIKLFDQKDKLEAAKNAVKNDNIPLQNQLSYILDKYIGKDYQFEFLIMGKEPHGRAAEVLRLVDGETVRNAYSQRQLKSFEKTRNVAIFGAGLTYTTIFGASRGRLDFVCWASAAFLGAFVLGKWTSGDEGPFFEEAAYAVDPLYWRSVNKLRMIRSFLIMIAISSGIVFIALSVIFMNPSSNQPTVGSTGAIYVSGYIPVGILAVMVAVYLAFDTIIGLRSRIHKPPRKGRQNESTHFSRAAVESMGAPELKDPSGASTRYPAEGSELPV